MKKLFVAITLTALTLIPTVRAANAYTCRTSCSQFGNSVTCNQYCY
jgi:hypothetical protein